MFVSMNGSDNRVQWFLSIVSKAPAARLRIKDEHHEVKIGGIPADALRAMAEKFNEVAETLERAEQERKEAEFGDWARVLHTIAQGYVHGARL